MHQRVRSTALCADVVLGRAQDRLDRQMVSQEIGEAQRRHHAVAHIHLQARVRAGRRGDGVVGLREDIGDTPGDDEVALLRHLPGARGLRHRRRGEGCDSSGGQDQGLQFHRRHPDARGRLMRPVSQASDRVMRPLARPDFDPAQSLTGVDNLSFFRAPARASGEGRRRWDQRRRRWRARRAAPAASPPPHCPEPRSGDHARTAPATTKAP